MLEKCYTHVGVVAGADYHLILEVSDVLNWVAHPRVVVKGQS